MPKSRIIGLTGGIASGKSTVTNYLREKGLVVIDADQVVRSHQEPGGRLYRLLVDHLGLEILDQEGRLDRARLGKRFFEDENLRAWSNQHQGQIIREILQEEKEKAEGSHELVFMDIPLLFEQSYEDWFDQIWLVAVNPRTQIERLMKRNGLTVEEAKSRITSQMSLEEKAARAQVILKNDGLVQELLEQVEMQLERLCHCEEENSIGL